MNWSGTRRSRHNTQYWIFQLQRDRIVIRPDFTRRCNAVDPNDHHLFVSLGCATENLIQAAAARGLRGDARFDPSNGGSVQVALEPARASASPRFDAIPMRQYARFIRSSAGIADFVSDASDKQHRVEAGRCYERFALQATALGIRTAMVNQPVEVPAVRATFAHALGIAGGRPDLVVRFGHGPEMPRSLMRPVASIIAS